MKYLENLGLKTFRLETFSWKPYKLETFSWKPSVGNLQLETFSWKPSVNVNVGKFDFFLMMSHVAVRGFDRLRWVYESRKTPPEIGVRAAEIGSFWGGERSSSLKIFKKLLKFKNV